VLTPAHPFFPRFVQLMREVASLPPVYDLGTDRRFTKEVGLVRDLFEPTAYFAGGFAPSGAPEGEPCDFHCDIESMPQLENESAGSVICLEVLEHVEHPARAVSEIHRILKPGGVCVAATPFLYSYHGKRGTLANPLFLRGQPPARDHSHAGYGDYWRFTHEGLALLFAEAGFARVDVWPVDGWLLSRVLVLGLYSWVARIPFALRILGSMEQPRLGRATSVHFVRALK
jgi:SAM-dependent methyltransferase